MVIAEIPRDFFVWIDPLNIIVRNNACLVGSFTGGPPLPAPDGVQGLPFIENPKYPVNSISPFHMGLINHFSVEYNLEQHRTWKFANFPSRFHALFLLPSLEEAKKYREAHPDHVGNRILKQVRTSGPYTFSQHDASWIDFLRLPHGMEDETIADCNDAYWSGELTERCRLKSYGKVWHGESTMEILLYGRVDFLNREMVSDFLQTSD